jgi:hypothetical protein
VLALRVTMLSFPPAALFTRDDLPAFGRPTTATNPHRCASSDSLERTIWACLRFCPPERARTTAMRRLLAASTLA